MTASFECVAVVPAADRGDVAVVPAGPGTPHAWELPAWRWSHDERHWSETDEAAGALRERLGCDVTVLRCVRRGVPDAASDRPAGPLHVFHCEALRPGVEPAPPARWISLAAAGGPGALPPIHVDALAAWLAERDRPAHASRSPWAEPGWLDAARQWADAELARLGLVALTPFVPRRSMSISCLLSARTGGGRVYLKASPAMFPGETAVASLLAAEHPGWVPAVLAADTARRWMLMEDVGDVFLGDRPALGEWEETLRRYARLQRAFVGREAELEALGCRDRGLDRLRASIPPLIAGVDHLGTHAGALARDERERLSAMVPALVDACTRLAGYHVPATLEHGDLHPWNIAVRDGAGVVFDWSDACVSHPFFSLVTMLGPYQALAPVADSAAARRDAYLGEWREFEPIERLREACALALPLARVHQALSYRWIGSHLEPDARWEWEGAVERWLRALLEHGL